MSFSIGDPKNPTKDDKHFESRDQADLAAMISSLDGDVWAVWDDDDGELLALAFNEILFG